MVDGATLRGRSAVVTGGTQGIGRAIAASLVAAGADVMITARTAADVQRVAEELTRQGPGRARGEPGDVARADDCGRVVERAVQEFGRLDILVNNAGVGLFSPVADMTPDEWTRVLRTNLDSVFYCSHAAIPHLRRTGDGWIINIGSLAGKNAFPGGAAYVASKFAVVGFSEALMQEVRHEGIRVSCVMPGSVATGFGGNVAGGEQDWKVQPEDIAQVVMDLLAFPGRSLPSRVEIRPSRPPKKS